MPKRYPRRALLALAPIVALAACGEQGAVPTPTAALAVQPPTPAPVVIRTIPGVVRSGSAVIPSPIGQGAATLAPMPPPAPTGPPPPTIPLPTPTAGIVLAPLMGGTPFTTPDGQVTLRHPTEWEAQASAEAAYFYPRGAQPTDPATPRVSIIGQPVQLNLLVGDTATQYTQTIVQQSRERVAADITVRSIDRVTLGGANGLPALRILVNYTAGVPVVSEQVIVQPPGSDRTYFFIAVSPATEYESKYRAVLDGMAGSLTFR